MRWALRDAEPAPRGLSRLSLPYPWVSQRGGCPGFCREHPDSGDKAGAGVKMFQTGGLGGRRPPRRLSRRAAGWERAACAAYLLPPGLGYQNKRATCGVYRLGFFPPDFCFFLCLQEEGGLSVCNPKVRKKDVFKDFFFP